MNNQLKLPWILAYRATRSSSRPAVFAALAEALQQVKRPLRRAGQINPRQGLGRGYAEFTARRHSLR